MKQMEEEYAEQGIKAISSYEPNYKETEEKVVMVEANKAVALDGSISYTIPEGYELQIIDGEYYGVKVERNTGDSSKAIITNFLDADNNYVDEARILRID